MCIMTKEFECETVIKIYYTKRKINHYKICNYEFRKKVTDLKFQIFLLNSYNHNNKVRDLLCNHIKMISFII